MKWLITLMLLLAVGVSSHAQEYLWYPCHDKDFPHWLFLYKDGEHVGGWDRKNQHYLSVIDLGSNKWSEPCEPPYPVPEALKTYGEPSQNFGVELTKVGSGGYQLNGKEITREEAFKMVGDKTLADDSNKRWLTFLDPNEMETFKKDKSKFGDLTKDLILSGYKPGHWHVDGLFAKRITLQNPDGVVLASGDKLPGDELFATLLRKTDPNYDPRKDPSFEDYGSWNWDWSNIPTWIWFAVGGGAIYFLLLRGKATQ